MVTFNWDSLVLKTEYFFEAFVLKKCTPYYIDPRALIGDPGECSERDELALKFFIPTSFEGLSPNFAGWDCTDFLLSSFTAN